MTSDKIGKLGGRKFVLALIAQGFIVLIFVTMLVKGWLTSAICMQFVTYEPILLGIFVAGNSYEKHEEKKK